MKPCKFTFDCSPAFDGFEHGSTWNGFDNVYVDSAERDRIAAWCRDDGDAETADDMLALEPMPDGNISFGWGYATQIVSTGTRYVVRDKATQGADFLMWGDNDPEAAQVTLRDALADGLDVELVTMPAHAMDEWTAKLIEG